MKTLLLNIAGIFVPIFVLIFWWEMMMTQRVYFDDYSKPILHLKPVITQGKASWYDYQLKGYPNYSKENYTAASRDYPRGTKLRVCRYGTSCYEGFCVSGKWQFPDKQGNFKEKCVDVRVNDYVENPDVIIDLSSVAFKALAPLSRGIIDVEITELK